MSRLVERRKAEWDKMMKKVIYDAAMAVLNEHGFEGLKMDRVAKAAEVATGTLYNYFKDKNALLLDVLESKFDHIYQGFLEALRRGMTPKEKLEIFVRQYLTSIRRYRSLIMIVNAAEGLSLPIKTSVNKRREKIHKLFAEIIEQGIEQGSFRQLDPLKAARFLFGALNGFLLSIILENEDPQTIASDYSECVTLIFSGLIAPKIDLEPHEDQG